MASICYKLAEWARSPFSAVVYFQKHFVDDVADTVKRQKEQFDRHTRERQERAIQLHLDELEGKYLCCVCGRPGESREDDELVYDTFSMVTLPERRSIERGLRQADKVEEEEEESIRAGGGDAGSLGDERRQRHLRERREVRRRDEERQRHRHRRHNRASSLKTPLSSRNVSSVYDEADDEDSDGGNTRDTASRAFSRTEHGDDGDSDGSAGTQPGGPTSGSSGRPTRTSTAVDFYGVGISAAGEGDSKGATANQHDPNHTREADEHRDLPALDPDLVPPLEVSNLMYKIRHAVLNREARTKRKAVHVHRDKGLTKIEESEIDMYSSFFQRPVHGFLCQECFTSARKRLDTVTEQIQTVLFKAKHPLLRKVSRKEVEALSAAGQLSAGLAATIFDIQRRWSRQQEATAVRASRMRSRRQRAAGREVAAEVTFPEEDEEDGVGIEGDGSASGGPLLDRGQAAGAAPKATLSDAVIFSLRATVKCAVCQRRPSCFFNRVNVLFLCQFCTARDRFYREGAVCINDEPLPAETVHLLMELAKYHEGVHRAQELRQLPQTELASAPTDLFQAEESLFKIQSLAPPQLPTSAAVPPTPVPEGDGRGQPSRRAADATGDTVHEVSIDEHGEVVRQPILLKVAPRPFVDVQEMARREADVREVVGTTQLSLFEHIKVEPIAAMDLFATTTGGATDDLFVSQPQAPAAAALPSNDHDDLFGSSPSPSQRAPLTPGNGPASSINGYPPTAGPTIRGEAPADPLRRAAALAPHAPSPPRETPVGLPPLHPLPPHTAAPPHEAREPSPPTDAQRFGERGWI